MSGNIGGTAYYDTDLDITWTTDANINGLDQLADHETWAAGLVFDGVSDWRLASLGEMQGLYASGITTASQSPFINIQSGSFPSEWYISSTSSGTGQWAFRFTNGGGSNFTSLAAQTFSAWAVADGDVFNTVPIPAAAWMFGTGLLGLFGVAKRRKA